MEKLNWKDGLIDLDLYKEIELYNMRYEDNSGFYLKIGKIWLHFYNTYQLDELLKGYYRGCDITNEEPLCWENLKIICVDCVDLFATFEHDYEKNTMKWEIERKWKERNKR